MKQYRNPGQTGISSNGNYLPNDFVNSTSLFIRSVARP
jgi:hypothetical protein